MATGLANPVLLAAPAGSTVITPLTTLLADLGTAAGVAAGLRLGAGMDLTQLDPVAAALAGSAALDPSVGNGTVLAVATQVMDTAVDFGAILAASGLYADPYGLAMATITKQVAPGGRLDLANGATLNAILQTAIGGPIAVLTPAAETAAVDVVTAGNAGLAADGTAGGAGFVTTVNQQEHVAQGEAAPALATLVQHPGLAAATVEQFTGSRCTRPTSSRSRP